MTTGSAGIGWFGSSEGPTLMVGSSSGELRRELGPAAWSALEILALAAQCSADGTLVATLNAREIAHALGIGREAAGNALARLRRRGLIVLDQARRDTGHFTGSRYAIRIELLNGPEVPGDRTRRRVRRPSAPTLFDVSNPDGDDGAPEVSSRRATRHRNVIGDSQIVARDVIKNSHTLALSMPPDTDAADARC